MTLQVFECVHAYFVLCIYWVFVFDILHLLCLKFSARISWKYLHRVYMLSYDSQCGSSLLQAEEAQQLKRLEKRKKSAAMRLLDMERRQKLRVEEIRKTQKKVCHVIFSFMIYLL